VPGHAAVLLTGVAKQERRMKRRHEDARPVRVQLAAQLGDALLRADEGLRGEVAEREDDARLDGVELRRQEGIARRHLVRLRIAVPLGPALHHVGDVAVALTVESHRREHLREELTGTAHEGFALLVFLLTRAFAHHHQPRAAAPGSEDDGGAALAELAARASLECALLLPKGVAGIGEGLMRQLDLAHTEVAMVTEGLDDSAEA